MVTWSWEGLLQMTHCVSTQGYSSIWSLEDAASPVFSLLQRSLWQPLCQLSRVSCFEAVGVLTNCGEMDSGLGLAHGWPDRWGGPRACGRFPDLSHVRLGPQGRWQKVGWEWLVVRGEGERRADSPHDKWGSPADWFTATPFITMERVKTGEGAIPSCSGHASDM